MFTPFRAVCWTAILIIIGFIAVAFVNTPPEMPEPHTWEEGLHMFLFLLAAIGIPYWIGYRTGESDTIDVFMRSEMMEKAEKAIKTCKAFDEFLDKELEDGSTEPVLRGDKRKPKKEPFAQTMQLVYEVLSDNGMEMSVSDIVSQYNALANKRGLRRRSAKDLRPILHKQVQRDIDAAVDYPIMSKHPGKYRTF